MNDRALEYLDSSDGWEIGVGPSVVIVDKGKAKSLTTTTLRDDVYTFIFYQEGLIAVLETMTADGHLISIDRSFATVQSASTVGPDILEAVVNSQEIEIEPGGVKFKEAG